MPKADEVHALIQLLDDPDEVIYNQIKDKLMDYGVDIIPMLEAVWESSAFGVLFQNRIEQIVHDLQFDTLVQELINWKRGESHDLLEGLIIITRYQYPDLDTDSIYREIEKITKDIWIELNDNLTALEKVRVINHMLFEEYGFSGNTTNYHAPQNSFINHVLESKKGNPISLSILYMIIANRLELPIYGVNLPRHFILGYTNEYEVTPEKIEDASVIFYINPFSKGTIFHRKEIDHFIGKINVPMLPEFYQPCDHILILNRVCNNLIYSFDKLGYPDKKEEIKRLQKALSE